MNIIYLFWILSGYLLPEETKKDEFNAYKFLFYEDISPIEMQPMAGGELRTPDSSGLLPATISDFWMGQFEITWEQYDAFVYNEIENFQYDESVLKNLKIDGVSGATAPYVDMSFGMGKDQYPATNMTQYGALMFCKWLSALTGEFYRLPTEAEWEYACRMGEEVNGYHLDEYANYEKNSKYKYAKVGSYKPDNQGLYDMKGNVAEWTMDQYSDDFYNQIEGDVDPWIPVTKLYPKVVRGGSWKDPEEDCQCTSRRPSAPNWKKRDPQMPKSRWWHTNAPFIGFRIVRPREQPPPEIISKYWLTPIDDYN